MNKSSTEESGLTPTRMLPKISMYCKKDVSKIPFTKRSKTQLHKYKILPKSLIWWNNFCWEAWKGLAKQCIDFNRWIHSNVHSLQDYYQKTNEPHMYYSTFSVRFLALGFSSRYFCQFFQSEASQGTILTLFTVPSSKQRSEMPRPLGLVRGW